MSQANMLYRGPTSPASNGQISRSVHSSISVSTAQQKKSRESFKIRVKQGQATLTGSKKAPGHGHSVNEHYAPG